MAFAPVAWGRMPASPYKPQNQIVPHKYGKFDLWHQINLYLITSLFVDGQIALMDGNYT
jgi:hypothetical protein